MSASQIGIILLVACVVAMLCRRLRLPYSVGLVSAGIVLTLFGGSDSVALRPDLITTVLLPPLIFEAALQLEWRPFRNNLLVTATLAFPGTLLSAAIVAAGMHLLLHWGWLGAALFGALIAATDPVSVISAFKEMRVERRLRMLVESESLLNDGAAAVAFAVLVMIAQGSAWHPAAIAATFCWMLFGGIAVGAAVAGVVLLIAGRTEDHLVEITLTTIAAYGSFLVADHLHMSGVLASLAAGLVVGNVGWMGSISGAGREHVISFWEYVAFLANSVVFLLIGRQAAIHAPELFTVAGVIAVVLVLLGRVAAVYPICALFGWSRFRVAASYQHVLVWGGLRGALGLALALAVPSSVPERGKIIIAAFAVVAFSVFVQGLSMPWMIRVLHLKQVSTDGK